MSDAPASLRRVVLVTRRTDRDELVRRHATLGQARFALADRGIDLDAVTAAHETHEQVVTSIAAAVPRSWRRASVERDDLDRFAFEPDDVVVCIGPDGLVPNVARYVVEQPVIGVDAGDGRSIGLLTPHAPADAIAALRALDTDPGVELPVLPRVRVSAEFRDGTELVCLNELFVGHRSHQTARYHLAHEGLDERQASSGCIVSTGTGATGWAASIHRATACPIPLPRPDEQRLLVLVRESWPSAGGPCTDAVEVGGGRLVITSLMDDGVVFGDGMEHDARPFRTGDRLEVGIAHEPLRWVTLVTTGRAEQTPLR